MVVIHLYQASVTGVLRLSKEYNCGVLRRESFTLLGGGIQHIIYAHCGGFPPMASIRTALTDLLDIEYPIVQAAMGPGGQPALAAAVSDAGGFGMLSSPGASSPRETRDAVNAFFDHVTSTTDKKFGINVLVGTSEVTGERGQTAEAMIEEILVSKLTDDRVNEQLKVIETSAGSPEPYLEKINEVKDETDLLHFQKVANLRHAKKAESFGVDGITASGFEMGGHTHRQEDAAHTFVLIPAVVEAVDVPVVASGGVRTGRSLLGALALGADGVYMGSRFIATKEADMHDNYKEHVLQSEPGDDLTMDGTFGPLRVLESPGVEQIEAAKEELHPLEVEGLKGRKMINAMQGSIDDGLVVAGQVAGYIDDKPSVEELIDALVSEAVAAYEDLDISVD